MYKLLVVTFAILLTVACTKQRDTQFAQGQGEELLRVQDYDGKTFEISTGAPIEGLKQSHSKARQLEVNSKAVGKNSFSVVNYEVNDPLAKKLLGDTVIVGKPHTKYKGLIRVEQKYVKIYKVAHAADLPLSETSYAIKLNDNELAVPLIGYPITSKVNIERQKNQYGEKSSVLIENAQSDITQSSHFRMDYSASEIFEPVIKTDVLPSSYFAGEWYFAETVVAAAEESSEDLGYTSALDQTLTPSTRVKFMQDETTLKVANLNVDRRLIDIADANFKLTLLIPIEWKSYRVSSNGQGMSEQEDQKTHWSKRPFIQVKFDQTRSAMNSTTSRLVSLEIKDDYLSFAVEDANSRRVRYSFMRVKDSNYQPKQLMKADKQLFGFFETHKAVAQNFEISRKEDIEKNIFISRFNPKGGKVVFNFTKTTPQWIRPTVQEAINNWNDAFKKAFEGSGTSLEIVLDSENDVELGDLRYNAINIIENLTSGSLFGVGPSLTDPFSGEIISATTNVHLTPIREALIREIRHYIQLRTGQMHEGRSIGISSILAALQNSTTESTNDGFKSTSDFGTSLDSLKVYLPKNGRYALQKIDFRLRDSKNPREFDVAIASGNIQSEIAHQCTEVITYIEELEKSGHTHNDKEIAVLDTCSRKLVVGKFMGTLVHELGHNFGLRHNFMASNDIANFMPAQDSGTEKQVRSSSVMEYSSFNEDRLTKPGPYDIAAIRFGYTDRVQLADGKIHLLDSKKTISQNLSERNLRAHTFKFCTDEDVMRSVDPMCQRHDAGVTPLEVVKNVIADYQAEIQILNFRKDAITSVHPQRLAAYRVQRYFAPLMRFYEEWRTGLSRYVGQDEQYLEHYDEKSYNELINRMANDPQTSEFVKQYFPVSQAVFTFMRTLANLENRYCVLVRNNQQGVRLEELTKVREHLFFNRKIVAKSCEDAQQAGYWNESGDRLMTEVGHFLKSFRYDLSDKAASEPIDVIGTEMDRAVAASMLSQRTAIGYDARFRNFTPSLMDEPQYRLITQNYILSRVIRGLPGAYVAQYVPVDDPNIDEETRADLKRTKEYLQQQSFPLFSSESELISVLLSSFRTGINIPGKPEASEARRSFISGVFVPASQQNFLQQAAAHASLENGYFAVTNPEAKGSIALINQFKTLQELKSLKPLRIDSAEATQLIELIKSALPTTEEFKTITTAEVLGRIIPLEDQIVALLRRDPSLSPMLDSLDSVMNLYQAIKKANETGNEQALKQIQEIQKEKFSEVVKRWQSNFPTKETYEDFIKGHNSKVLYYQENRNELDAQIELLKSFFITILNS